MTSELERDLQKGKLQLHIYIPFQSWSVKLFYGGKKNYFTVWFRAKWTVSPPVGQFELTYDQLIVQKNAPLVSALRGIFHQNLASKVSAVRPREVLKRV